MKKIKAGNIKQSFSHKASSKLNVFFAKFGMIDSMLLTMMAC